MKTTIDAAGRIVIPKDIRHQIGLEKGTEIEIRVRNGVIEIEPLYGGVKLVWQGRWLVAVSEVVGEPLTSEMVEQIRQDIYRERGESWIGVKIPD